MKKLEFDKSNILSVHSDTFDLINMLGQVGYFSDNWNFEDYVKGAVAQICITDKALSDNKFIFTTDTEGEYRYFIPAKLVKEFKEKRKLKFDTSKVYSEKSDIDDLVKLYKEKAEGYFSLDENFKDYNLDVIEGIRLIPASYYLFSGQHSALSPYFIKKEDAEETIEIEEIKE